MRGYHRHMGSTRLHEQLPPGRKQAGTEEDRAGADHGAGAPVGPLAELQRKAGNAAVVGMLAGRAGTQGDPASTTIAGFSLLPGAISREWAGPEHGASVAGGLVQRVKIAGFNMSAHAAERRNRTDISTPITNKDIEAAITGGTAYDDGTGTGGVVYYLGDVAVVTSNKNIVTVYRTPAPDKPKARWSKL